MTWIQTTSQIKRNCEDNNAVFEITDDPVTGYEDAHVVYSRHWITANAYQNRN